MPEFTIVLKASLIVYSRKLLPHENPGILGVIFMGL